MSILSRLLGREQVEFCSECGKPLLVTVEQRGYDRETGKPRMVRRAQCPDTAHLDPRR